MGRVFIGVDPHKLSATIEVVDERETVLATGRLATDKAGYAAMRRHVAAWPERTWAVEGSPVVADQQLDRLPFSASGRFEPATRPPNGPRLAR